jgi:hypothetical protein
VEIGLKLLAIDLWVPAIEVKIVTSLRLPLNEFICEGMAMGHFCGLDETQQLVDGEDVARLRWGVPPYKLLL